MDIAINYTEHEYQDAYIEPYSSSPVYTSYVELELNIASDECIEGYKCDTTSVVKDTLPYEGELDEVYVVICRFNNLAANIYEDWNIVGAYTSSEEAEEMAGDFSAHAADLKGLSKSLILLYCEVHPLLFEKV